jgi:hypothetical protein
MRNTLKSHWIFILLLLTLSVYYFWGLSKVPFHPDESTQLYMSADFEQIITYPLAMAWEENEPVSSVSRYRLLDAPLTRYLLGFGRNLFSLPPLASDWDWSASWEENQRNGALPNDRMLLLGRLIIASLFPLGLVLLYRIGIAMDGRWLGIFTVLLFSSNALILLHTRRAMAEGTLVFGVILTLYALIFADKRPLLVGLAVAIAFNAKQSAVALLPIGLLAVCWIPEKNMRNFPLLAGNSAKYLAGFALLTALLNPFLWRQPVSAAQEALQLRQDLFERQVADYERLAPGQVLESPAERSAVLLAQLFFTPPSFSEVGNYREFTKPAEAQYLLSPSQQLWRNPISGVILFGLAILGMVVAVRVSFHAGSAKRRLLLLYLFAFLVLAIGIISMIPLPWQRYSIPLIPIITIFISLGFVWLIKNSRRIYSHGRLSARLSQVLTQFAPDSWMS